jgi:hypothetical protein
MASGTKASAKAFLPAGEVFRDFMKIWETGDFARFDALVSKRYVGHVAAGDRDREGLRQRILVFRGFYPVMHFEIEDQFASGDRVATRMLARGRNAKGEPVALMGINISRVHDGKLEEEWNTWEPLKGPAA